MKNFIYDALLPGTKVQISTVNHVVAEIMSLDDPIPVLSEKQNLYWLGGVHPDKVGRAGDDDIIAKNYFYVDFDIRSHNEHITITDQDIKDAWSWMKAGLDAHELLKSWSYCVFSGNGLHVYYFLPDSFTDKKEYAAAVGSIAVLAGKETMCLNEVDTSCVNIGRLARLPGSINQKTGQRVVLIDSQ